MLSLTTGAIQKENSRLSVSNVSIFDGLQQPGGFRPIMMK